MKLNNGKEKFNEKITTKKYICAFHQFETIRYFRDNIYAGKINIDKAKMDQSNLLENMVEFNGRSRTKQKKVKIKRRDIYGSVNALFDG